MKRGEKVVISLEVFLLGLLITSSLTSLVTEAIKKISAEHNFKYHANTLAGVVALVLSIAVGVCYVVFNNMAFDSHIIVCLIAQVFMSWLCSMVGYDKVMQAIGHIKNPNKED